MAAGIRKATSKEPITYKEAYKAVDTTPTDTEQMFLYYPAINTEANYSDEELSAIKNLDKLSGGKPGQLTHVGYRKHNLKAGENRYAGDISVSNFNDPYKVVEWSVGQTSQRRDNEGNKYLGDGFNFDIIDTEKYIKNLKNQTASPVMYLRALMGIIGSKGYTDGTNSSTAIQTRIPISTYEHSGGHSNYLDFFLNELLRLF